MGSLVRQQKQSSLSVFLYQNFSVAGQSFCVFISAPYFLQAHSYLYLIFAENFYSQYAQYTVDQMPLMVACCVSCHVCFGCCTLLWCVYCTYTCTYTRGKKFPVQIKYKQGWACKKYRNKEGMTTQTLPYYRKFVGKKDWWTTLVLLPDYATEVEQCSSLSLPQMFCSKVWSSCVVNL